MNDQDCYSHFQLFKPMAFPGVHHLVLFAFAGFKQINAQRMLYPVLVNSFFMYRVWD